MLTLIDLQSRTPRTGIAETMASAMSDSEESAHSSDAELRLVLAGVKSLPTGDAPGRSALVWGGGCAKCVWVACAHVVRGRDMRPIRNDAKVSMCKPTVSPPLA